MISMNELVAAWYIKALCNLSEKTTLCSKFLEDLYNYIGKFIKYSTFS